MKKIKSSAQIFYENYNKVLNELKSDFLINLSKAKGIKGKEYFMATYPREVFQKDYDKVQSVCRPYGFDYIHDFERLELLGDCENEEAAINEAFKKAPPEKLQEHIINTSTLKAYYDCNLSALYAKYLKDNNLTKENKSAMKTTFSATDGNIYWEGTEPELVQVAYAFYEAKLLTNDKKEITYLVKQLAEVFNFELKKNWQSTLSKNIRQRKYFDKPPVFDKINAGYKAYYDRIISKER